MAREVTAEGLDRCVCAGDGTGAETYVSICYVVNTNTVYLPERPRLVYQLPLKSPLKCVYCLYGCMNRDRNIGTATYLQERALAVLVLS